MDENQYVVFKLDEIEFGIEMRDVREIIRYEKAMSVPNAQEFIEGIINHRGDVIPIINLKKRFLIGSIEITNDARILIVKLNQIEIGFIVENVSEIIRLSKKQIDPTPPIINGIDKKYINGIGKLDEKRLLIIIDLEKILSQEEIDEIKTIEM